MTPCVEILVNYEDVNSFDISGYTPLLIAYSLGNVDIINILLEAGADPLYGLEFNPIPDSTEVSWGLIDETNSPQIWIEYCPYLIPSDCEFIRNIDSIEDQSLILEGLSAESKKKMAYLFGFDTFLKSIDAELTWPEYLFQEIIEKKYTKLILALFNKEEQKLSWTLSMHNLVITNGLVELYPFLLKKYITQENLEIAAEQGNIATFLLGIQNQGQVQYVKSTSEGGINEPAFSRGISPSKMCFCIRCWFSTCVSIKQRSY